ncbi:MAG: SAV_2336 N-terminal domain-related protein, partial [Archangium sp.]
MSEDAQDSWRQPLQDFIGVLRRAGVDLTGREIAEALWLASQLSLSPGGVEVPVAPAEEPEQEPEASPPLSSPLRPESSVFTQAPAVAEPEASLVLPSLKAADTTRKPLPFRSPGAPALPHARALARALRPLKRSIPSRRQAQLDEQASAERIAGGGPWIPVMRPARSRWLEVALVVDASRSMVVWHQTLEELRGLLRYHGAFRDVRAWSLVTDAPDGRPRLYRGLIPAPSAPEHNRRELVEPLGRRLILVASDCVSPGWHSGAVEDWLHQWSRHQPTAILEMLPQHLWGRTALRRSPGLWLHGTEAGVPNRRLLFGPSPGVLSARFRQAQVPSRGEVAVPVVTLEREALADWVRVVLGLSG